MITDNEFCKDLNLLRDQSSFVYREDPSDDKFICERPKFIPRASGAYWIAGTTVASSGLEIPSVFRVDTDSGGTLTSIYWWVSGNWYKHDDEDVVSALLLSRKQIFPFDWAFAVPLEEDVFHSENG